MNERQLMQAALQERFVPVLHQKDFRGEFPHFQRVTRKRIELLSVSFDKLGGAFVLVASYALRRHEESNLLPQNQSLPLESVNTSKTVTKQVIPEHAPLAFCDVVEISMNGVTSTYALTQTQKRVFLQKLPPEMYQITSVASPDIYQKCADAALRLLPAAEKWWQQQPKEPFWKSLWLRDKN